MQQRERVRIVAAMAIAVFALVTDGAKNARATDSPAAKRVGPAPRLEATTSALTAKKPLADIPEAALAHVQNDARRTLGRSKEARERWPDPDEMALAFFHATQLLARLARTADWASSPAIASQVESQMLDVYHTTLFERQAGKPDVSDKEIETYYKQHPNDFRKEGQFWIRYIFLNTVDNPEQVQQKRALAEKALAELKAGTAFDELARKYSEAAGEKGEVVGPVQYGEINPELEKPALALEPGQTTGVITTKYGFTILQLDKKEPPTTQSLGAVRDTIAQTLLREKRRSAYQDFLKELERRYPVQKNYSLLDNPQVAESQMVVTGDFLKLTVADYRKRLESLPASDRPRLEQPDQRKLLLDAWVDQERIRHAARREKMQDDPDVRAIARYLTDRRLAEMYLEKVMARVAEPTDDEVRKYYEENRALSTKPAMVRLRELVISYRQPAEASPRDWYLAERKATAQIDEAVEKLKGGADFVQLVKQYSTAESAKQGGDIGFVVPAYKGQEVAEAVAELKIGEATAPIRKFESFSVFRLEERKPEETVPLDEGRKLSIRKTLLRQKQDERAAEIWIRLAEAYRKDLPVEEIGEIVEKP